ncbi:MAG: AEC family transporter [Firmicutes bacterium]|nr:AEC family transporter [Bacillota bacterium]
MLQNIITVAEQVLILFILIGLGFTAGKTKLINNPVASGMTNVVLYFVTPCVIVNSFQRDYDPNMLQGLLIAVVAALASHGISILLAHLLVRDKKDAKQRVLRFSVVFSNCGFMSLPLQQALLGADGVFYGAAYIAIFNILGWSYGVAIMSQDSKLSLKKILLNPGVISVAIGIIIFFTSYRFPNVIGSPITYMAALNTPIPMFLIGFHLSQAKLSTVLTDLKCYWVMALRLILSPLISLGIFYIFGLRGTVLVACMIAVCAPVAAMATMFADKFGQDTETSVGLVSISTLLSIITMPIIVGLTQTLA